MGPASNFLEIIFIGKRRIASFVFEPAARVKRLRRQPRASRLDRRLAEEFYEKGQGRRSRGQPPVEPTGPGWRLRRLTRAAS